MVGHIQADCKLVQVQPAWHWRGSPRNAFFPLRTAWFTILSNHSHFSLLCLYFNSFDSFFLFFFFFNKWVQRLHFGFYLLVNDFHSGWNDGCLTKGLIIFIVVIATGVSGFSALFNFLFFSGFMCQWEKKILEIRNLSVFGVCVFLKKKKLFIVLNGLPYAIGLCFFFVVSF